MSLIVYGQNVIKRMATRYPMKRVRILNRTGLFVGNTFEDYATMTPLVFLDMFFPSEDSYTFVNEDEEADICCYGPDLDDDTVLRNNELNVFISVENLAYWCNPKNCWGGNWSARYLFYRRYKHFGSKKTDIYIHNDKTRITSTPLYKCIPTVFCRIAYYNKMGAVYRNCIQDVPFEKKHFILFISKNNLNSNKRNLYSFLRQSRVRVHHISMYDKVLKNTSCYHSRALLSVFSRYKFIAAFENSHTRGYVTEKIFNVFMAKSVPVYDGAPDVAEFINPRAFIPLDRDILKNLLLIGSNKQLYDKIVNVNKIQPKYKNLKINF